LAAAFSSWLRLFPPSWQSGVERACMYRTRAAAGAGSACGPGTSPTPDLRESARDVCIRHMRKYRRAARPGCNGAQWSPGSVVACNGTPRLSCLAFSSLAAAFSSLADRGPLQLAWLRGRRARSRELPGAAVGACTRSRRISRATREALLPTEVRCSSFHRICLNLKIWNRLMGRFEYRPVDPRWRI
jgi:hypothetical protein